MTWQGTGTAGLAAPRPGAARRMARPECFVSRWKVQRKLWTPENTRGPPLRGQRRRSRFSGLTRPSRLRGAPLMGRPKAFDCAPQIRLAQARSPTTLMSALARALKEKGSQEGLLRKGQKRRGLETCRGGSASGEADRANPRRLRPRSRRTKRCKKEGPPVASAPSSLKLRSDQKAGRFCRSWQNVGRQWLAPKRQPPCGGRGCGCRAAWPCRQDCR